MLAHIMANMVLSAKNNQSNGHCDLAVRGQNLQTECQSMKIGRICAQYILQRSYLWHVIDDLI